MRDIRRYSVYPSNLNMLESFDKLDNFLKSFNFEEEVGKCGNSNCKIRINSERSIQANDYEEFMKILVEYPQALPIDIHSHFKNAKNDTVGIIMTVETSGASVIIESDDLHLISSFHDKIKNIFQLLNPKEELEKKVSKYNLKKSIFLAHRFDNMGNEYSRIMIRFLSSIGFKVLEGSGYESRDIPSKVLDKIKQQDIFICLVTPGNHSWILSEASTAKALNKYIVIICQANTQFDKGILGQDFEYISFPEGFIEKIFADIIYALPS